MKGFFLLSPSHSVTLTITTDITIDIPGEEEPVISLNWFLTGSSSPGVRKPIQGLLDLCYFLKAQRMNLLLTHSVG